MDKSWITKPRNSRAYDQGVKGFIEFAFQHGAVNDMILCPCPKCGFSKRQTRAEVYDHLICKPFPKGYTIWYLHGESHPNEAANVECNHNVSSQSNDVIQDLSPNIGVFWYFFAEVFEFFRSFFLIVFHINILFMLVPLGIRLRHRPCFLAFVYIAIMSMLKPYPSGTGNANFYFATGIAYASLQTVLIVESVSTILKHDRMLRNNLTT